VPSRFNHSRIAAISSGAASCSETDHQCPSFLEYAEYPYVSATEIKKALKVKASLSTMLDQMQ
jgi:hypothetical protein